jgi:hypothetical protein
MLSTTQSWIFNIEIAANRRFSQNSIHPFDNQATMPPMKLEARMIPVQIVFLVITLLTVASGTAATAIVLFGDTRRNAGQKAVAEKLAQIAAAGMTAIVTLLALRP